jgi:hypothetical protein
LSSFAHNFRSIIQPKKFTLINHAELAPIANNVAALETGLKQVNVIAAWAYLIALLDFLIGWFWDVHIFTNPLSISILSDFIWPSIKQCSINCRS